MNWDSNRCGEEKGEGKPSPYLHPLSERWGKLLEHDEKGSEKRKREPLSSPYLHHKSLVFNTIRHMNIKRWETNKKSFTVFRWMTALCSHRAKRWIEALDSLPSPQNTPYQEVVRIGWRGEGNYSKHGTRAYDARTRGKEQIGYFSPGEALAVGGLRKQRKRKAGSKSTPIFMPTSLCPPIFASLGGQGGLLYAPPLQLPQRRYLDIWQGLYRLRQVWRNDGSRRDVCHQDEEESTIRNSWGYDVYDLGREDRTPRAASGIHQTDKGGEELKHRARSTKSNWSRCWPMIWKCRFRTSSRSIVKGGR